MSTEALIAHRAADARVAVRAGVSINAGHFIADVLALAQLPAAHYVMNTCRDRYFFAVGLGAALIAGRTSLLPPSRAPEVLAQVARRYPDTIYLGDDRGHIGWRVDLASLVAASATASLADASSSWPPPQSHASTSRRSRLRRAARASLSRN